MTNFENMTVVQLKELLTARGLTKTGNKADLIARLRSKKTPAKKTVVKKTPAKKSAVKKTTVKKSAVKKTPAKKSAVKKTPAKKTFAGTRGANKTMKSALSMKSPAKKTAAKTKLCSHDKNEPADPDIVTKEKIRQLFLIVNGPNCKVGDNIKEYLVELSYKLYNGLNSGKVRMPQDSATKKALAAYKSTILPKNWHTVEFTLAHIADETCAAAHDFHNKIVTMKHMVAVLDPAGNPDEFLTFVLEQLKN